MHGLDLLREQVLHCTESLVEKDAWYFTGIKQTTITGIKQTTMSKVKFFVFRPRFQLWVRKLAHSLQARPLSANRPDRIFVTTLYHRVLSAGLKYRIIPKITLSI